MTSVRKYGEASPGAVVDRRYRVRREIARGGMGVVFEAEHELLQRPVALKTLTGNALEWPVVHARLYREARALSIARHPGVVPVLDAGMCEQHGPYLALAMIEGRSLESYIVARRGLSPAQVVAVAAQVGAALAYVHARGVIHRDVKPANLLVGQEPGRPGDVVHLIDFGIARLPGAAEVVDDKLTRSGELLGTVEYMAPERLLDNAPATVRSDVYALGVTLYECLMGDVPFQGPTTALMTALVKGAQPPSIRAARPDVPAALEAAILKAIARRPEDRFATADAFSAACLAALPGTVRDLALLERQSPDDGPSRRAHARAAFVTPVRIMASSGPCDGRTEDISVGGALVVTEAPCNEGERVKVRLPLPTSGRVVLFDAITRWARTRRGQRAIGLAFVDLPEDVRADIERYVTLMTADAAGGGASKPPPA